VSGPCGAGSPRGGVRVDQFQFLPSKKDAHPGRYFGLASTGGRHKADRPEDRIESKMELIAEVKRRSAGLGALVSNIGYVGYRGGRPGEEYSWGEMARLSQEAGADAVSLHLNTGQSLAGRLIAEEPDYLRNVVREAKAACSIPIIAKLPMEGCDPAAVCRLALEAGADAVAPVARYVGLHIDVESETVPDWGGYHGFGGPWSLPITTAWTGRIRRDNPRAAILPGGGVMSWEDVARLLLAGATMAQVCTWPILKGYEVLPQALRRLRKWMEKKGYRSLDDFRGKSLAGLKESGELWARYWERGPYEGIWIEGEKCKGCGACAHVCFFDAIRVGEDKQARIDEAKCVGCGCCFHLCPTEAIQRPRG